MAAPRNFVTGFNHNIKHAGQVFHVQTEDSGESIGALTTHLFVGGTIVATRRSSYGELRGAPDLPAQVRALMEAQHKQMLRDLVDGAFDDRLHSVRSYQPGQLAPAEAERARAQPPPPPADAIPAAAAAASPPQAAPRVNAPAAAVSGEALSVGAPASRTPPAPARQQPTQQPPRRAMPPPPPPPTPLPGQIPIPRQIPLQQPPAARPTSAGLAAAQPPAEHRTLPGAVAPPPPRQVAALSPSFGEDLISEQSLDEVILSYLAESEEN